MIHIQLFQGKGAFLRSLSVLIASVPLFAYFAYIIAPSDFILFQWLGLAMPVLLLINILIFVIAAVIGEVYKIQLLLIVLSWICYLPLMFQYNGTSEVKNENLIVCTYNVRGMCSDYGFSTLMNVVELSKEHNVDVMCLQEVPSYYTKERLLEAFDNMQYVMRDDSNNDVVKDLVILSKYPLKDIQSISNMHREYAVIGEIDFKGENIVIVNCHLQTTSWNQIKSSPNLSVVDKLFFITDNSIERENQVRIIKESIGKLDKPLVLLGDFNDSPVSFTYQTLKSNLKDSFREAGNGFGYTYSYLMKLFRIDYVFYDGDKFDAVSYENIKVGYSDHLPVKVDLMLVK